MTDNTATTAITVYVPREQALPNKFEIFLKKTGYLLHRYFLRNKKLFCALLFSFALLFSLFTVAGKLNYQNTFVLSIYFSNEFCFKFVLLTVCTSFLSIVPILGRAIIGLYSTCIISVLSTFVCAHCFYTQSEIFEFSLYGSIASAVIFLTIVITVVLFDISSYRDNYTNRKEFIKGYYFRIFAVLFISLINYFLLNLIF